MSILNRQRTTVPTDAIHLPNGYTVGLHPAFNGFSFKVLEKHPAATGFPPGWTIVLQTRRYSQRSRLIPTFDGDMKDRPSHSSRDANEEVPNEIAESDDLANLRPYKRPTLNDDYLFISSIMLPPSGNSNTPSPSRHIAMMLYATLWWYFHQEAPEPYVDTPESMGCKIAPEGRPHGDWRIYIKQEGIFKRGTLQKLERMGLVMFEEPVVGFDDDEQLPACFVSRRAFWQTNPRIFLFPLVPNGGESPFPTRSSSPSPKDGSTTIAERVSTNQEMRSTANNPYYSTSRMPTYYPPPPQQYTFTNGVRHPHRQKPANQGEIIYIRYVPSLGQTLSFRVPSLPSPNKRNSANQPVQKNAAMSPIPETPGSPKSDDGSVSGNTNNNNMNGNNNNNAIPDIEYLHQWMNNPRVNAIWGMSGPQSIQEKMLREQFSSRHSFPLFGCWDEQPFGYFEMYWVKEDNLGRLLGGGVDDYDRGIHVLVGEEKFRGKHRLLPWLSSLVHLCFLSDYRTQTVFLEPRVDNVKFINYLYKVGFYKKGEVTFPHKQSAIMKIKREYWEAPFL